MTKLLASSSRSYRLRNIWRTFQLVWSTCKGWAVVWGVLLIVQGLLPVATVQLTRLIVDGLTAAIDAGGAWTSVRPLLWLAVAMGGVLLLTEFLRLCAEWVRTIQSERVQDYIAQLVHAKSGSLDMGFFELSDFYDHLHRARNEAASRPLAMLENSGIVLQNGITLFAMAAILLPYGLWLPPALFLSTLPALYVVTRASRQYHKWWSDTTMTRRRIQYFDLLLIDHFHAGELRLFGFGGHFQRAYQALRTQFLTERFDLLRRQYLARVGAELVGLIVAAAAMAWMGYRALLREVTLGDLALFYQAFQKGQGLARALLTSLGQVYSNSLYLTNLFEFLDLESRIVDAPDAVAAPRALHGGISFRNVCFRYPGSRSLSLNNFTAFIPAGKIVALVGENGAGKTTALKLVARFYDPESGGVELDGVDLRRMSQASLRGAITYMVQAPGLYQLTVRENIGLGNLAAEGDTAEVARAAQNAGADDIVGRLPNGYDTLLGRWFGGTELSSGEWQRIALARAFMRQAPVMLLDEPTSALDSWAEADWFRRLRRLATDRTVMLVTHRLTIAMRADLILVMMDGRVVESGSHQELLAQGGRYARSWRAQVDSIPEVVGSHSTAV
ncbi:MAG: ABC transporter ATP-binding protein [Vicinamibacterales bacterium]